MRAGIILSLLLAVSLLGACNRDKGSRFALESGSNPNPNNSSAPVAPNPAVMCAKKKEPALGVLAQFGPSHTLARVVL